MYLYIVGVRIINVKLIWYGWRSDYYIKEFKRNEVNNV